MRWFGLGLAGLLVTLAGPALAQPWGLMKDRNGPQLSHDDLDMVFASAAKVNRTPGETIGASDTWANPKTGAKGTTSLTRLVKRGNAACHLLHHEFTFPGGVVRNYDVTWCPAGEGVWKIAE